MRVDDVDGTQMAARISGTFEAGGRRMPFTAVAFGRIGGQNVVASLDDGTASEIRGMGLDPDSVVAGLQQDLIQGSLEIPDGIRKESFLD